MRINSKYYIRIHNSFLRSVDGQISLLNLLTLNLTLKGINVSFIGNTHIRIRKHTHTVT